MRSFVFIEFLIRQACHYKSLAQEILEIILYSISKPEQIKFQEKLNLNVNPEL